MLDLISESIAAVGIGPAFEPLTAWCHSMFLMASGTEEGNGGGADAADPDFGNGGGPVGEGAKLLNEIAASLTLRPLV